MKKLICAKDIQDRVKAGEKSLILAPGMIMTPSAKDAARAAGLRITCAELCSVCKETLPCSCVAEKTCTVCGGALPCSCVAQESCSACGQALPCGCAPLDADLIYQALVVLEKKGMLDAFLQGKTLRGMVTGCCR